MTENVRRRRDGICARLRVAWSRLLDLESLDDTDVALAHSNWLRAQRKTRVNVVMMIEERPRPPRRPHRPWNASHHRKPLRIIVPPLGRRTVVATNRTRPPVVDAAEFLIAGVARVVTTEIDTHISTGTESKTVNTVHASTICHNICDRSFVMKLSFCEGAGQQRGRWVRVCQLG